ncbi:MAG: 3-isopropylmalate dehydratase [Planctomycetota bacterium]|jgi:3-isopropylmalate/(R)-2-methylmalate dehydratase small subunit
MNDTAQTIRGRAFVIGDNIDTDQIIPAEHLALDPTKDDEYALLGSHALSGLPESDPAERLVPDGETASPYAIIIAGRNFGCGSSREHAPIALGAAGVKVVVAESFDLAAETLAKADGSATCSLRSLGEVRDVVAAGGLFAYARQAGLVDPRSTS